MQIQRAVEVWEKGMDGALVGQWPVASNISTAFLLRLFAAEQHQHDPDMLLSYFLTQDKLLALQPYVAQQLDGQRYDFILTVVASASPQTGQADGDDTPFD